MSKPPQLSPEAREELEKRRAQLMEVRKKLIARLENASGERLHELLAYLHNADMELADINWMLYGRRFEVRERTYHRPTLAQLRFAERMRKS